MFFYFIIIYIMDKNANNVINILKDDKFKQMFIDEINHDVNIPILNEKTEEKTDE